MDNKTIYETGGETTNIVEIDISKMSDEQPPKSDKNSGSESEYYDEEDSLHPSITVHKSNHSDGEGAGWGQITCDGKYYISSNEDESIVWDLKEKPMRPILEQGIRFVGLYAQNRLNRGVI